jgi:hypothetical protein
MGQVKGRLAVGAAEAGAAPAAVRLAWVDNLKVAVIAGVVVVHAAMAYLIDADWYYMERTTSELWGALVGLPGLLGGVFALGPLFLLGGVFTAASLAGKGPGGFTSGRLLRLGVSLVLYVTVINPLANYLGDLAQGRQPSLWPYLAPGSEDHDAGPLWFVAALLTFSLVYAAWRRWRPASSGTGSWAVVRPRQLLLAAVVIAAGSLVVRLRWPFGSATLLDLRWPEWPQGAVLFTLGVLWGEQGWRGQVPAAWSRRCGQVAAAGLAAAGLLVAATATTDGDLARLYGGWHWPSLVFVLLEGIVAVSFSLWLLAWFGRRWTRQGPLARRASRGAYAAYVLHPLVLVLVSFAARPLPLAPEIKFLLVAPAGVATVFTVGWAVTRFTFVAASYEHTIGHPPQLRDGRCHPPAVGSGATGQLGATTTYWRSLSAAAPGTAGRPRSRCPSAPAGHAGSVAGSPGSAPRRPAAAHRRWPWAAPAARRPAPSAAPPGPPAPGYRGVAVDGLVAGDRDLGDSIDHRLLVALPWLGNWLPDAARWNPHPSNGVVP